MANYVNDELYIDWINRMNTELATLRQQRASGSMPQMGYLHTLQLITQYSYFLGSSLNSYNDIMAFFRIFVESLINPLRKANVVTDYPELRPCELWERFAEYYLRFINTGLLPQFYGETVIHTGKRNDRGVDVQCDWNGQRAVVQVKRGSFFGTGKGNDIVLKLIGSMVISGATFGIIFTNESYETDVKADAKELIQIARNQNLNIYVLGITEILGFADKDDQSCKRLLLKFIDDFLPFTDRYLHGM